MLPRLDETPRDTRLVVDAPPNPVTSPKHARLRFFLYLLLGFVVFASMLVLASWGLLTYFKLDIKSFMLNTKSDAYTLIHIKQLQPSLTPSPASTSWGTYTNTLHNYSLMYPPNWIVQQDTDETSILYPPGSRAYEALTIADLGAGLGPKILVTVITRQFMVPDSQHTTIKTDAGLVGYLYTQEGGSSGIPTVDFPIYNGTNILEFSLQNIGQENLDAHIKAHHATFVVTDIDMATFERIVTSLRLIQK